MLFPSLAILLGLVLLVWSADRFVDSAAAVARHFSVPPLLVGMVIIGFGTSAPEMVVSAMAAGQGNPGLALGNAWGSNIANIALILGITALINPITVHSLVLRKELPLLAVITALAGYLAWDGLISRGNAGLLLVVFALIMVWSIVQGMRNKADALGLDVTADQPVEVMPLRSAYLGLALGLLVLVGASRLLVWGAVALAQSLGVSDLVIGLTIVAIGTSLPELASCVAAARKREHDLALGNILGSNLFNTLAVVGIAGLIAPISVAAEVLTRDFAVMAGLTLLLFFMGWGFRAPGRINRFEGAALLVAYLAYTLLLMRSIDLI